MADQNKRQYRAGAFAENHTTVNADGVLQYLAAPVDFVHGCSPKMIDAEGREIIAHQPIKAKHFEVDSAIKWDHRENCCNQAAEYWAEEADKNHRKATEWRAMTPEQRIKAAIMEELLRKVAKFDEADRKIFGERSKIATDSLVEAEAE